MVYMYSGNNGVHGQPQSDIINLAYCSSRPTVNCYAFACERECRCDNIYTKLRTRIARPRTHISPPCLKTSLSRCLLQRVIAHTKKLACRQPPIKVHNSKLYSPTRTVRSRYPQALKPQSHKHHLRLLQTCKVQAPVLAQANSMSTKRVAEGNMSA